MTRRTTMAITRDVVDHIEDSVLPGESRDATLRRLLGMPPADTSNTRLASILNKMTPGDTFLLPVGAPGEVDSVLIAKLNSTVARVRKSHNLNLVVERHLMTDPKYPGQVCMRVQCVL